MVEFDRHVANVAAVLGFRWSLTDSAVNLLCESSSGQGHTQQHGRHLLTL